METNSSRNFDWTISTILAIVLWFSKMTWAFELLVVLLAILEYRQLERMRKQFLSEIPTEVILEIPLKAVIYDMVKFILAFVFLLAVIIFSSADILEYIFFEAGIFIGLAYYLSMTISYFHQLIHPRKAYLQDDNLYFYNLEINDIPLDEVEQVELKDNIINLVQNDKITQLHVKENLGREKVYDIKSFFMDRIPTKDNGFMYR